MIKALALAEFSELINNDYLIVDTRKSSTFVNGFIPGSVYLGLDGELKSWAEKLLTNKPRLILVTDNGSEEESAGLLIQAGFTSIAGYLEGGYDAWNAAGEEMDMIITVEPDEVMMDIPFDTMLQVVDVRTPAEFEKGHMKNALNLPLEEMTDVAEIANFEENQNLYILSQNNYRSTIAASLLKRQGYHNIRQVVGGWSELKVVSRES